MARHRKANEARKCGSQSKIGSKKEGLAGAALQAISGQLQKYFSGSMVSVLANGFCPKQI
jgi:hypothetical protein